MAKTQRLYDFKPGERIYSSQVDDEFNRLDEAHNALDDELLDHKSKTVDHTSSDTEKNKHVSNSDLKTIHDMFQIKDNEIIELDNRIQETESDIATNLEDITQLKANKADRVDHYEKSQIDEFLEKKMDIGGDHQGTWHGLTPSDVTSETINGARLDILEPKVENLDHSLSNFDLIKRELASIKLYQAASDRVPNGILFGTEFDDTFGMSIDFTKSTSTSNLTAGATRIEVVDATGFSSGLEVTVYDDMTSEYVEIIAVNGNVLTVTALANDYKIGAGVARTMADVDIVAKALSFATWGEVGLTYSDIRFKLDLPYKTIAAFITHDPGVAFTGLIEGTSLEEKVLEGIVNVTVSEVIA